MADRSFTAEEIEELSRFYQTELGKKTLALMPKIMQENMEIGKSWGKKVGPELEARMEARFSRTSPPKPSKRWSAHFSGHFPVKADGHPGYRVAVGFGAKKRLLERR